MKPELQARRRLVKDRVCGRVDVVPSCVTRIRRSGCDAMELSSLVALWTVGVVTVTRVQVSPQPVEASFVVGEVLHELDHRIRRIR